MKYASIVPLIGGTTIAMQNVFKKKPEFLLSYTPFASHDNHIVSHYGKTVPYGVIDGAMDFDVSKGQVEVVTTVCPCAGLSSLSQGAKSDAAVNDWMYTSAKYVLENIKPEVFWGENAPRLASKLGMPVIKKLRKIGKDNGYAFMVYKTKSILHGMSQIRDRTFYFFFRGDKIPLFPYFRREHEKIEDTITSSLFDKKDPMSIMTSNRTPSEQPLYQFVLKEIHGGMSHAKFQKQLVKSTNPLDIIEGAGIKFSTVSKWMKEHKYDKWAERCKRIHAKLESGGNIMRKTTEIPKDYIGAFVGHMPMEMTHPYEDRFLTIRECLGVMKLPEDFILQGGIKNLNHICQNVPVTTAMDMATCIKNYLDGRLDEYIHSDFAIIDNKAKNYETEFVPETLEKFL